MFLQFVGVYAPPFASLGPARGMKWNRYDKDLLFL